MKTLCVSDTCPIGGAHTKRLRTKRLLDKTSPYKTSP
jgi:hypothetical protein